MPGNTEINYVWDLGDASVIKNTEKLPSIHREKDKRCEGVSEVECTERIMLLTRRKKSEFYLKNIDFMLYLWTSDIH